MRGAQAPVPGPRRGILVVDVEGRVFSALHHLGMQARLWCVADASRVTQVGDMDLAIHASYGEVEWGQVLELAARTRTMIVADVGARADALQSLSYGLSGYIGLEIGPDALRRSILGALHGEAVYQGDVVGEWLDMQRGPRPNGGGLTPRQIEVLALVARGAGDKQIASALGITTATAQKHVTNILDRLGVPNRAAAVAAAFSPAARWLTAPLDAKPANDDVLGVPERQADANELDTIGPVRIASADQAVTAMDGPRITALQRAV